MHFKKPMTPLSPNLYAPVIRSEPLTTGCRPPEITRFSPSTAQQMANPTDPSLSGWLHTGSGAGVMGLLFAARQWLTWWPLHPIGYPVGIGWVMNRIWFSVFLAWAAKVLVLRFGVARAYTPSRPLFLGLALGQIVAGGLWLLVDAYTGKVGNVIPVY